MASPNVANLAAKLFEQAHDIVPSPTLQWNVARAYQKAGSHVKALGAFKAFLDQEGVGIDLGSLLRRCDPAQHGPPERRHRARSRCLTRISHLITVSRRALARARPRGSASHVAMYEAARSQRR